jgi:hypothetical protein
MSSEYEIVETFQIASLGTFVSIERTSGRASSKSYRVEVQKPDGTSFQAEGHQVRFVRRQAAVIEQEDWALKGIEKSDIPFGSRLRFID